MADAAEDLPPIDGPELSLEEWVDVFRILMRWDAEAREAGQGDQIRTAANESDQE
jgi:hypothetical protein